jgi:hypothetical protein
MYPHTNAGATRYICGGTTPDGKVCTRSPLHYGQCEGDSDEIEWACLRLAAAAARMNNAHQSNDLAGFADNEQLAGKMLRFLSAHMSRWEQDLDEHSAGLAWFAEDRR